jgi:L-lactate dehydrogenase
VKIAIVGAGAVGSATAYAALIRGLASELVIHDQDAARVESEVLDLNHGLQFVPMATVEGSADVGLCAGADVVVITAGAKQKPGRTRLDLAEANAAICRTLVPRLLEVVPAAMLLLVTNPVDVLTYVTLKLSGLPRERVLGSGTVLDSSRLRFLLARRCGVAVQNVHAYIAGEHGDSEIALWSSARIAGIPLEDWAPAGHERLGEEERAAILDGVKNAAAAVIRGKGATNYAIGLSTVRILEAIVKDERRVLPVSARLDGYRGLSDVCLSVPAIVSRPGVGEPLPLPMSAAEEEGLRQSAGAIRQVIARLGY